MTGTDIRIQPAPPSAGWTPGPTVSRRVLAALLKGLDAGELTVIEGDRRRTFGDKTSTRAEVLIHDEAAWRAVLREGSVGLGRGYVEGWWDSPDLVAFLRLLTRHTTGFDRLEATVDRLVQPIWEPIRRRRRPLERRDRDNVRAHYDLSNDFFELFLDPTMMYSCALFDTTDVSLAQASVAKLDRVCTLLDLGPSDHLVEIGTGWGGMAIHAAREFGCRVTTTTISAGQYDYARKRVADLGMGDRVTVLDRDYRELTGTYDKLVSIEMIEAVDWRDHDSFFGACGRLLRPGGRMVLQAITIPDDRFELRKNKADFVKRFIFPGGCLPSQRAIRESSGRMSDLQVTRVDEIGSHYVKTLRRWRAEFRRNEQEIEALGLDLRFRRMWDFYLAFCEAGFAEGRIGDVQMVLERPAVRER